ncbi:hypothetical protein PV325_013884 [Microctonus aethiopoides]|nr:hypothetical protein PV325_013884 [Microctonus aethiopoides]
MYHEYMEALQVAQHDSNDDDDDDDDNSVENDDEVMKIDLFEMVHARDSLDPYQTYGKSIADLTGQCCIRG